MQMGLSVEEHIEFCVLEDAVILFDTAQDRFFALPDALNAAFKNLLSGSLESVDMPALKILESKGILRPTPAQVEPRRPPVLCRPRVSLLEDVHPKLSASAVWEATALQAYTGLLLKCRPISCLLKDLRTKKSKLVGSGHSQNENVLRSGSRAFVLSQMIIPTGDRCLRRSLAMFQYLARRDCESTFVIGVKSGIFGAHAWLQSGDTVLNDTIEGVLPYRPIMVI